MIKNTLVGCFLNNLYDMVRILLFHKTKAVIESNNDSIRLLGKYIRLYLSWTARVWRLFTSASRMKVTASVILVLVYQFTLRMHTKEIEERSSHRPPPTL